MRFSLQAFLLALCCVAPAAAQQSRYSFDNFDARSGVRITLASATDTGSKRKSGAGRASAKAASGLKSGDAAVRSDARGTIKNKFDARIKPVIYTPPTAAVGSIATLVGFTTGDLKVDSYIVDSGKRNGVDPTLLYAIMHQESSFKPRALSNKGAAGLMQMMPGTATRFGVRDRYDPRQSVEGGARYMRFLLDFFDGDYRLALAGYNAGEGAVLRYGRRIPPYRETQDYVRRISQRYELMRDPSARRTAPRATLADVAKAEADAVATVSAPSVPPPTYERAVFAVRLPDGKLRLVSQ